MILLSYCHISLGYVIYFWLLCKDTWDLFSVTFICLIQQNAIFSIRMNEWMNQSINQSIHVYFNKAAQKIKSYTVSLTGMNTYICMYTGMPTWHLCMIYVASKSPLIFSYTVLITSLCSIGLTFGTRMIEEILFCCLNLQ